MEYWLNLDSIQVSSECAEDRLAAHLLDERVTGALWTFMPEQLPMLRQISAKGIDIALVVPNLAAYVRDVTGGGPIKAILTRFQQLPIRAKLSLCVNNSKDTLSVLKQDFGMGLSILAEMELESCMALRLRHGIISSAVVDLAVALNNRQVVERLLNLIQVRFKLSALIQTSNLGLTTSKMVEWGIDTSGLSYLSPLNRVGYSMRPNQAQCELVCRSGRVMVMASDIDADGELHLEEALSYIGSLGVRACILPSSAILNKGEGDAASG